MEEGKSKGNPYVMAFIADKGGAKKMQHEVDLGYQALVQLEKGMRFGSPATFRKLSEAYPGHFDIIEASTGVKSKTVSVTDTHEPEKESDDFSKLWAELIELRALITAKESIINDQKKEIAELKTEVREWQKSYQRISEYKLGIDRPGVKIGSSSRPTAKETKETIRRQEKDYLQQHPQTSEPAHNRIGF